MSPEGASSSTSNVRVFITWLDQTVFAGEEVKCTITFKNVARTNDSTPSNHLRPSPKQSRHASSERLRTTSPRTSKPTVGLAPPSASRGHRSSLSLSVPSVAAASRARAGSVPWSPNAHEAKHNGHAHKRSLSILSIGSAATADDAQSNAGSAATYKPQRPARGHARASSLQIVSRSPQISGPRSASHPQRPYMSQTSPLFHASFPPSSNSINGHSEAASSPNTLSTRLPRASPRFGPDVMSEFRFPMASPPSESSRTETHVGDGMISPSSAFGESTSFPIRSRDPVPTINEHGAAPVARILPTTSIAGTPRSSGEFYSLSNNSSETLASEYVTQQPHRTQARPPHLRRTSSLRSHGGQRLPEALMMGYAQVQGSFTLDGSLVNLGPFEQVKRKAVTGGQGGGVVGIETPKRDSGLLRGFGWGSLTSSIGELLGGGELSSIKDMRGIAGSKSIPLLSTPQSILFVDLQLAPGESKTFEYSFRLPKGLPPTHRGKAMKTSYSLVIGTQRPGGTKEQTVTSVDIPFRVLGSVNNHGEILGHDLMSPYIILRDQAQVQILDKAHHRRSVQLQATKQVAPPSPQSTVNSFLFYVDELLARPRQGTGGIGLLSPTAMPSSRRPSTYSAFDDGGAATAKEAIDLAILRANLTSAGQQSANRFEIARDGRRVGVVMLARPAYRLGESITLVVDFDGAEVPCYAVHAALETTERIDPSLALRSEASVHRVTRKVFVNASEATLYTRRVVFNPTIPVSATPEFITSGVSLEWKIRLEFVVPAPDERTPEPYGEDREEEDAEEDGNTAEDRGLVRRTGGLTNQPPSGPLPLLEEISQDDRGGLILVAAENLLCESFEVAVPLRVYGAVCNGLERLERDDALEEGFVV